MPSYVIENLANAITLPEVFRKVNVASCQGSGFPQLPMMCGSWEGSGCSSTVAKIKERLYYTKISEGNGHVHTMLYRFLIID
tara:strand:- start:3914 stop:4159 length:246 start_codon:yes stop_codon:yes gene_type:complete